MKEQQTVYVTSIPSEEYSIYLSGELGPPSEYVEALQALRQATVNDRVVVRINGVGGDLSTAVQFINAIRSSAASVTARIEGECHSALSLIFLAAEELVVFPNSLMLVHSYSSGAYGKGRDLKKQVGAVDAWFNELARDMYKGFLSDSELDSVLMHNEDLWLGTQNILDRLSRMEAACPR